MSGECDKCGEHCLQCACESSKVKNNIYVFIATPAFDGKVFAQYTASISQMFPLLFKNKISSQLHIATGSSLLVLERNKIIKEFFSSNATHLLCIDADLGWSSGSVIRMLSYDLDFVAGLYPKRSPGKQEFICMPASDEKGNVVQNEMGLLKMNYIPAGFMLMKRIVIERMMKHFPELYYHPKNPSTDLLKEGEGYCFFNTEVYEGEFWGEDYVFSRRVRESGTEIWVDPDIDFDHAGYKGNLLTFLEEFHAKLGSK